MIILYGYHYPGESLVYLPAVNPDRRSSRKSDYQNARGIRQKSSDRSVWEADYNDWTEDQLLPYLDTVLEAFGPDRLMFGSDWPVCLLACGYKRWHDIIRKFIAPLSDYEQDVIMGGTAIRAYKLDSGTIF